MKTKVISKNNRNAHWMVLLFGLLISYLAYQLTIELENRTIKVEQYDITDQAIDALNKELAISESIISSIRSFFLASKHVSRNEFKLFTEAKLKSNPSIQALEWIPSVSHELREDYRLQAVRDGLLTYGITEQNARGELMPAKNRAEYFPVYYVEPLQDNKTAIGFDLASNTKRLATLKQAKLSQQNQVTASISLIQDNSQQKVFLMVQPTYSLATTQSDKQKLSFTGFAVGVFKVNVLITSAMEPIKSLIEPLQIQVTDITDSQNIDLLYSSQVDTLTRSEWSVTRDIHFSNRVWRITSTATDAFLDQYASNMHWLVLLTGCVLTLLLSSYIRTLIRRELLVQNLVAQRAQELQSSESMSRAIIDNAVDSVITIDDLGSISLFSPAAEKLFGYHSEEVLGKNIKMLMPEPYQSEHDGYLQHHKQTGEKRIIGIGREVRGLRKDGSTFPMNLSVGKTQVNNKILYVGTVTDLTELKNNERKLQDYNDRLDIATRAGRIGVWDYDILNHVLVWDDLMYEIYHIDRERSLDPFDIWHNAMHDDDTARVETELMTAIKGGKYFDSEFRINLPGGEERHIQASGVVLFNGKGLGERMIGVNLDVTERRIAEENMRKAKLVAEQANRQKSTFLNIMSHELRTPLTVILGYLPVLKNKDNTLPPEAIAQLAQDMDISGQHLLEMINDLLDISKIEAGQMTISLEELHCQPLITEIIRKFDYQAQQKGIELLSESDDFTFQVDLRHLKQILINLIGNALKFTHQGSITISAKRDKNFVSFGITDTGIGIAESELPFIFDTFRQVDESSTRKVGGSGLGLAITKRLVELHGGTIEVDSAPGSGTTFTFTIKQ